MNWKIYNNNNNNNNSIFMILKASAFENKHQPDNKL